MSYLDFCFCVKEKYFVFFWKVYRGPSSLFQGSLFYISRHHNNIGWFERRLGTEQTCLNYQCHTRACKIWGCTESDFIFYLYHYSLNTIDPLQPLHKKEALNCIFFKNTILELLNVLYEVFTVMHYYIFLLRSRKSIKFSLVTLNEIISCLWLLLRCP